MINCGYGVLDPLRGKDPDYVNNPALYTPNEIVVRDKYDILKSDLLLVEYTNPTRNYAGTSMEIMFAYEHHKPIVIWSEHAQRNYWLQYHATIILPTLDECLDYIVAFWSTTPRINSGACNGGSKVTVD